MTDTPEDELFAEFPERDADDSQAPAEQMPPAELPMGIEVNRPIAHDPLVAAYLRESMPYCSLSLDLETSGNEPARHGMLSLAAIDPFAPSINFAGECYLRDGAVISQKDIKKNLYGKGSNILRIINPHGVYSSFTDRVQPFIEPNDAFDFDLNRYDELVRFAKSVLESRRPGHHFIETSETQLLQIFYQWMQEPAGAEHPEVQLTHYSKMHEQPAVSLIGQNVNSFDKIFIEGGFARAGIGSYQQKRIVSPGGADGEQKIQEHSLFLPFAFAYRSIGDVGQLLADYIAFVMRPEDAAEHFYRSSSNRGQRTAAPYMQASSGFSLDAVLEFTGMPTRPDPTRTETPHDAFEDAKMTLEAFARLRVGRPYLTEFAAHAVPFYLSKEYRAQSAAERAASLP